MHRGPRSTAATRRKISPATASGSSPPTSTRPAGSSTSVDTPVSSTEPTGGSRVTSRRSRSSSSSSRPRTTPLSGASSSSPGTRSGTRRTGGSRSSCLGGDRRLAPRRLGAGGADAQHRSAAAPRHGDGRLRACVPQPTRSGLSSRLATVHGGGRRVEPGLSTLPPDATFTWRTSSRASRIDAKEPFTLTTASGRRRAGATEFQSRRSDFVFTHRAFREHAPTARRERLGKFAVQASARRLFASFCASATSSWHDLFAIVLPSHALAGKTSRPCGANGSTTRRRAGHRHRAFLVSGWERGKQIIFARNPRYWGPHARHLDRSSIRFRPPDADG